MFYAQLADRLQPRFIKIKPYILTFQFVMFAVFSVLIYSFFVNFWLAAGLFGLAAIICNGFTPPLLSIIADSSPKGAKGSAISLWMIISGLSTLVSTVVLGKLLPQGSTRSHYQMVLAIYGSAPFLIAAFCFYMSSFDYARIMENKKQERTEAVAKAIEIAPEIVEMSQRKTLAIEPHIFDEAVRKAVMNDGSLVDARNQVFDVNHTDSQLKI